MVMLGTLAKKSELVNIEFLKKRHHNSYERVNERY
jgi:hypothetical protein